jgi:hypothetical protein
MRKYLSILALCLVLPAMAIAENERPVLDAVKAFRGPMEQMVGEAAKGNDADLAAIAKAYAEAKATWLKVTAAPLELDRYGVPANQQEEVWRQVRTVGMLIGYLDEALQRGDRALIVRAAGMLTPAYEKVAAALGAH